MAWDGELDRLATYVEEHFGVDVLKEAGRRAIAMLTPLDMPEDAAAESDDVMLAADGQFYDLDAYWEAVRVELQRLIRPQ